MTVGTLGRRVAIGTLGRKVAMGTSRRMVMGIPKRWEGSHGDP